MTLPKRRLAHNESLCGDREVGVLGLQRRLSAEKPIAALM
jgi:hypothetical protein